MLYDHEDGMKDGVNAMETSFDVDICAVERLTAQTSRQNVSPLEGYTLLPNPPASPSHLHSIITHRPVWRLWARTIARCRGGELAEEPREGDERDSASRTMSDDRVKMR
jgi:hypothetical protein